MTDRIKGFTVTLEQEIRIDDVEPLLQAVRQLRGVAHVEPSITTSQDHINREMIRRHEMAKNLWDALKK